MVQLLKKEFVMSRENILDDISKRMDIISADRTRFSQIPKKNVPVQRIYRTFGPIFSEKEMTSLQNLMRYSDNFEVEASFGIFKNDKIFQPGLKSQYCFNQVKDYLEHVSDTMVKKEANDLVETIRGTQIRRITDLESGDITFQKKHRDVKKTIDNIRYGIRFTQSSEEYTEIGDFDWERNVVNAAPGDKSQDIAVQRYRKRTSFSETDKDSFLFGFSFDLTTVREVHIQGDKSTWQIEKREVEIERKSKINASAFMVVVEHILRLSQNNFCSDQLLDLRERRQAINLHNNVFRGDIAAKKWRQRDPYLLFSGYWNKPKNIKINDMLEKNFDPAVTVKLNGRRNTILIDAAGIYMYSPPYDIFRIGEGSPGSTTVIDVEFLEIRDDFGEISRTIYGFDCMFFNGRDVRHEKFLNRICYISRISPVLQKNLYCGIVYKVKKYFLDGEFYDRTRAAFEEIERENLQNINDGLIFQPKHWYKNNHTFKWKPEKDLTIDFSIVKASIDDINYLHSQKKSSLGWTNDFLDTPVEDIERLYLGKIFWLLVGDKNKDVYFNGTKFCPYPGFIIVDNDKFNGQNIEKKIIECEWNYESQKFQFYRFRDDRNRPNNLDTARSVWEDIMSPIPRETIEGKTLQLMRKYHNKEKYRILSQEFKKGDNIIDVGSGRGGDLRKWNSLCLKNVIAVEPNEENRNELKKRKKGGENNTSVYIVPVGVENTDIIKSTIDSSFSGKLNGIVSFFSLTFFPENKEKYDSLLETIDLIPLGGKFVGAVMDGRKVREVIEELRENTPPEEGVDYFPGESEEDSAFIIRQLSEFDEDPMKNLIEVDITDSSSMVTEQEEWLFYFDYFESKMEDMGFVLRYSDFLDHGDIYEKLSDQGKAFSKLNRVFVFERAVKKQTDSLGEEKTKKLQNHISKDLYITGVKLDNSNFLHAVLQSTSKMYKEANSNGRTARVLKIRNTLAKKMTLEIYLNLHGGRLSDILSDEEKYGKEARNVSFAEFKKKLLDDKDKIGESTVLELASNVLGVDIYVLKGREVEPSRMYSEVCSELYVHDKAVILYTADDNTYCTVSRFRNGKHYYIFNSSSPFIQKIKNIICED